MNYEPFDFELFSFRVSSEWCWLTILNFQFKNQCRSLFHIEYEGGTWKFQFLFLPNHCFTL